MKNSGGWKNVPKNDVLKNNTTLKNLTSVSSFYYVTKLYFKQDKKCRNSFFASEPFITTGGY